MSAHAACERTPASSKPLTFTASAGSGLSSNGYLLIGVACFLISLGVQLGGYQRLLRPALRAPELAARGAGLKRWVIFLVSWQVLVLVGIAAYAIPIVASHPRGFAWAAPPLGAIMGTALPLQLAVSGIARSAFRG